MRMAWPYILANSSTPLLGLVDTAVVGRTGKVEDLGAIALGAMIFNFIYWSFGFLRMGTTGFVAREDGRGDEAGLRDAVFRSLSLGGLIGLVLIFLQFPIIEVAIQLLGAGAQVETITTDYFYIRIWAAPASLGLFSVMGALIGLGKSTLILRLQFLLNGLNIIFDLVFAGYYKMGAEGVALGTLLAAWITLFSAVYIINNILVSRWKDNSSFISLKRLFIREAIRESMKANSDIMIRTLMLISGFAWFTDQSARYGNSVLAANHILLQFITFSAFFLDGFAFTAEALVGRAAGGGDRTQFDRAVVLTGEFSALFSIILSIVFVLFGEYLIQFLTDLPAVVQIARSMLPWAALYILFSFAAFLLDGIFIGTVKTKEMRNSSIVSTAGFLLVSWMFTYGTDSGVAGLWISFICFVLFRALTLGLRYRVIRREIFTVEHEG